MTEIPEPTWNPRNAEYHALRSRWSSSMLKTFRASPQLARARYVDQTMEAEPPSAAMVKGSLVNCVLLKPEDFDDDFVRCDTKSRNSKAYRELVETNPDRHVVPYTWVEEAESLVNAFLADESKSARVARKLLLDEDGYSEYFHQWDDPIGEVPCKMMLDKLGIAAGRPTYTELKTTALIDPGDFQRHAHNMEYQCQAAMNLRGCYDLLGEMPQMIYVVVGSEPPHEVMVYTPSEEYLMLGAQRVEEDLRQLGRRLSGDAPWLRDEQAIPGNIPVLSPPNYALRDLREGVKISEL